MEGTEENEQWWEKKYPWVRLPAVLNPPHLHPRQWILFSISYFPAQRGSSLCSDQTSSQPQRLTGNSYFLLQRGWTPLPTSIAYNHLHVARLTAAGTPSRLEPACLTSTGRLQLHVFESLTEQPQSETRVDCGRYGNKGAGIVKLEMWSGQNPWKTDFIWE